MKGKIHLACGNRLIYCNDWLGRTGYACMVCRVFYHKYKVKGGSYPMPFPKDVARAGDIAKEGRGEPIENYDGIDLLLESFTKKDSTSFGKIVTLECQTEDGNSITLSTFSGVIASQVDELAGHLPCIITPKKVSNYYCIY